MIVCGLPKIVALNSAAMSLLTRAVCTANTAVCDPSGIVIMVGPMICAKAGLRLATLMTRPPAGATAPMVTVPIEIPPPCTFGGENVRLTRAGALTSNMPDADDEPAVAVKATDLSVTTPSAVTRNVALVWPAAMTTDDGAVIVAPPSWLSETVSPPVGAGFEMETVPVEDPGPVTELGENTTLDTVGGLIVKFAVAMFPAVNVAVIAATRVIEVGAVETGNVTPDAPEEIVTEAGTDA